MTTRTKPIRNRTIAVSSRVTERFTLSTSFSRAERELANFATSLTSRYTRKDKELGNSLGTCQIGSRKPGPPEVRAIQIYAPQIGPFERSLLEAGMPKVSAPEISSGEPGRPQIAALQDTSLEIGPSKVHAIEICTAQVSTHQADPWQAGPSQLCPLEVN